MLVAAHVGARMELCEIACKINEALSSSATFVHCVSMHEYSIQLELYALSIQIETGVEIVSNDGTSVVVDADYTRRTEQSFSILRLVGTRVLGCRFDDEASLVLELAGGESVRCIADEPVESYIVTGVTDLPLTLP